MNEDKKAREAVESGKPLKPAKEPAGPHAKEHLIDRDKTPGSGSLPEPGGREADVGPD
ncbi:hypothetical protein [Rhizobium sp. LC145]|uniref:hypothetical protein n=1 Tax=Rhizobium sp. LC145 TaxID=1120688 RepID=UPI000A494509|nr:hypothetical protein [Rhizobium sp. LC145]